MSIQSLFLGINVAEKMANYLGIIESIGVKLDKLSGAYFESGVRSMQQAVNSECEQKSLFQAARNNFNKAISLEENERLALSYIGLAFCHNQLGDIKNTTDALQRISYIEIKHRSGGKLVQLCGLFLGQAGLIYTVYAQEKKREEEFDDLKSSVQLYLQST